MVKSSVFSGESCDFHDHVVERVLFFFLGLCVRRVFEVMLGIMMAYLSIPVVQNLLSSRQAMNTSFDSFRIVNTYGAFGR